MAGELAQVTGQTQASRMQGVTHCHLLAAAAASRSAHQVLQVPDSSPQVPALSLQGHYICPMQESAVRLPSAA